MRQLTLQTHLRGLIRDHDDALALSQEDDSRAVLLSTRDRIARLLARIEARAAGKEAPPGERPADGDVRDFEIG